jgi:hypothetical protein
VYLPVAAEAVSIYAQNILGLTSVWWSVRQIKRITKSLAASALSKVSTALSKRMESISSSFTAGEK